jgi:hypothetical protein
LMIFVYGANKISLDHFLKSKQEWSHLIKKNQKTFTNFLNLN